ncbi:hypothetical protein [Micromonospora profundi]|uniref:hypothetical protein n=1 Tax=Micromonospora profundi TaxID=1420889 RepID=UPI0036637E0F
MKSSRIASAVLILAAATALAACGDGDAATNAGSTTTAPTSAAATSAAPSPTAPAMSDKEICESAQKASDEMKAELLKIVSAGEPSAADYKKILTGLEERVTTLATAGGDSKLATALKTFGAEAAKAAAAADPATAADNPAFEKAGTDITTACKAAGVTFVL